MALPKPTRPGDAFTIESAGEGKFVLSRVEKTRRKIKLTREKGFLVASAGKPITMEQTRALMDEFP